MPSVSSNNIKASDTVLSIRNAKKKESRIMSLFKALIRKEVEEDSNLFNTNVYVICVGSLGSGKSSFIEKAAGVQRDIVGHSLQPKTEEVEGFELLLPELVHSKITLVDTPGFDDTNEDRILSKLAAWLSAKGSGTVYVLYFHPISTRRMPRGSLNWRDFKSLCGGNNFHRVVLVTTMWDKVVDTAKGAAAAREEETKENYWACMIELGSPGIKRFLNDPTSAHKILTPIVNEVAETTPAVLNTRLEAKLHKLKVSLGASSRFLQDTEREVLDYMKRGDELRTKLRQQVLDPDRRQKLIEEYQQASKAIQSRFNDAKKLSRSGNIFQKLGARLWGIFSNTDKSQQKGEALPVGDDNVLQPQNNGC